MRHIRAFVKKAFEALEGKRIVEDAAAIVHSLIEIPWGYNIHFGGFVGDKDDLPAKWRLYGDYKELGVHTILDYHIGDDAELKGCRAG